MAARENQGYLIAVIILVLITLVLALVAFLGINKAFQYADERDDAENKLALQKNLTQAYDTKSRVLMACVGDMGGKEKIAEVPTLIQSLDRLVDPNFDESQKNLITDVTKSVNEVYAQYENDMKQFIAAPDAEQAAELTWRSLTRNLAAVLSKKHFDANVLRDEAIRIKREAAAEIAAREKIVVGARESAEKAKTELQTEKERFSKKELALNTAMKNIQADNDATIEELKNARDQFKLEKNKYESDINTAKTQNVALKTKVDRYEKEVFDLPDAKIVRSSPEIQLVHINIGSADGLRVNRTFSVYDQTETNFVEGQHKATIEVTEITGPHQAVAKVTSVDSLNPILQGDNVLTATWDPGYHVPIALVGFFDLDHDGRSDRKRLVTMIEKNGGKVVAQNDEDGNVIGKIDSSTRYVVLGNEPDVGPNSNTQILGAIKTLLDEAKANSVQEIDLRKLLNWMGVHGQAKIERLDSRIGDDFRRRDPINFLKSRDR